MRGMDVKVEWSGMDIDWTLYTRLTADYRNRGSLARDLARHHYHNVYIDILMYTQEGLAMATGDHRIPATVFVDRNGHNTVI